MFLSRLELDPMRRPAAKVIGDCQALHVLVMLGFPDDGGDARKRHSVLHRLESDPRTGKVALLVQATIRPDWTRLDPSLLAAGQLPETKDIGSSLSALTDDRVLRFRLRANTVKRVSQVRDGGDARWVGRRVPVQGESERIDWLRRKGEQHGFAFVGTGLRADVPDLRPMEEPAILGWRSHGERRVRLTLAATLFEGRLRVVAPEKFRAAVVSGIGPAKAYGCGLLSLAPA